jgi:hypothetical protein
MEPSQASSLSIAASQPETALSPEKHRRLLAISHHWVIGRPFQ